MNLGARGLGLLEHGIRGLGAPGASQMLNPKALVVAVVVVAVIVVAVVNELLMSE